MEEAKIEEEGGRRMRWRDERGRKGRRSGREKKKKSGELPRRLLAEGSEEERYDDHHHQHNRPASKVGRGVSVSVEGESKLYTVNTYISNSRF